MPEDADIHVQAVVVGCQREDGRWLLIRRSATVMAPHRVAFPGGRMEPGETQRQAAVRELREELGAEVELVRLVWKRSFVRERRVTLHGWLGRLLTRDLTPAPDEVAEILWLSAEEAIAHPDAVPDVPSFLEALAGARGPTRAAPR